MPSAIIGVGLSYPKAHYCAYRVVQEAIEQHNGVSVNALRSILKEGIERVRPEGERRFTAEWILYNILEMKFMEGRKVREIALRLAMSEADLYRKQRVAIEAVANAIAKMEHKAREERNRRYPQNMHKNFSENIKDDKAIIESH